MTGLARRCGVVLLAGVLLTGIGSGAAAAGRASIGRLGVMMDDELLSDDGLLGREAAEMRRSGVQGVRVAFYWRDAERCRGCPPDWRVQDRLVMAAARQGLPVLPVVLGAPPWAAVNPRAVIPVPRRPADLGAFLKKLVGRYGPRGSFWARNPSVSYRPIRAWQVWNEPELVTYMPSRHWPGRYVALLRAAARAIRSVDRRAKVVLAGLTTGSTGTSWNDLRTLYRAGARRWFDVAAVHPFTRLPENVVEIVRRFRSVMQRFGDRRKPLSLTEVGWPAKPGWCEFCLTERDQGLALGAVLPLLAAQRRPMRISSLYVYTWLSGYRQDRVWDFAGLRAVDGQGHVRSTPAYEAFRAFALPGGG